MTMTSISDMKLPDEVAYAAYRAGAAGRENSESSGFDVYAAIRAALHAMVDCGMASKILLSNDVVNRPSFPLSIEVRQITYHWFLAIRLDNADGAGGGKGREG